MSCQQRKLTWAHPDYSLDAADALKGTAIACIVPLETEHGQFSARLDIVCEWSSERGVVCYPCFGAERNVRFERFCAAKSVAHPTRRALQDDMSNLEGLIYI